MVTYKRQEKSNLTITGTAQLAEFTHLIAGKLCELTVDFHCNLVGSESELQGIQFFEGDHEHFGVRAKGKVDIFKTYKFISTGENFVIKVALSKGSLVASTVYLDMLSYDEVEIIS